MHLPIAAPLAKGYSSQRSVRVVRFLPGKYGRLFLFFVLFLQALSSACASPSLPRVTLFAADGSPVHVGVEVAATPTKRNLGLMYRRDLPVSQGMLFLFPREEQQSFWMKNTPLPLDIIFISAARTIVSIAANTLPFSETPLPSGGPAQFVLEVNAGFCQRHGIVAGGRVEIPSVSLPPS